MRRTWIIVTVLAALALRIHAFAPFDISHADELMQYLEQARRLATGDGIVPWEYRFGARNGLIAQMLAIPWWLTARLAPGTLLPMLVTRACFTAVTTALSLLAAWRLGALTGRAQGLLALFVAGVWYESVLFSTLLLSEVLATGLIALALSPLLARIRTPSALRLAGLLLGLGVLVRLQYAPFVAVFAVAALRADWKAWGHVMLGVAGAACVGAVSDLGMGHWPFQWVWVNLTYNIGEGRAARFGTSGPLEYLRLLYIDLGPAAPFLCAAALMAPAKYRPVMAAVLANLLFHSLIAHKEYRFIWLSVFLIVVLAAITSVGLAQRLAAKRHRLSDDMQLLILAIIWVAASLGANAQSGGARTMRGGAPIPLAALDGTVSHAACGIGIPDQWRAHLVPALLPRPVPLYIAPLQVMDATATLPPDLARAANVLVFAHRPLGSAQYREVSCHDNGAIKACLFVRPGGCTPAPQWSYQAVLIRDTL